MGEIVKRCPGGGEESKVLWSSYLIAGDADASVGDLLQSLCVKVSEGKFT